MIKPASSGFGMFQSGIDPEFIGKCRTIKGAVKWIENFQGVKVLPAPECDGATYNQAGQCFKIIEGDCTSYFSLHLV